MVYTADGAAVRTELGPVRTESNPGQAVAGGRLARVTAYWAGEGDYYTGRCISATGVRLHDGHCAVDPSIIPYGSVVEIAGVGKYLAVDTGSAVISRTAAREGGHTSAERNAIVVDLFFEDSSEGERFAASAAKYVSISWWTPTSTSLQAQAARSLFAEEDWSKIQSKQL
jgi:3D (Asp-Asp-Asp) domain-containing protein